VADKLSIRVAADATQVAVVRRAISAFARALGMHEQGINELSTAVTEACDNTVLHAYGSSLEGELEVIAAREDQDLGVRVRDFGGGLQPQIDDPSGERLRLGLTLMSSLAGRFDVRSGPDFGTEISMSFDLGKGREAQGAEPERRPVWAPGTVQLIVQGWAATQALRPVLTILAAQEGFKVDRIAEVQLIGDLLARGLAGLDGDGTSLRIDWEEEAFRVSIGPLADGLGRDLLRSSQVPGFGEVLGRLADDVQLDARDGRDMVRIHLGPSSPGMGSAPVGQ
jgi:anti-sigma regulatory factor (Ser/Thr protein kinase)